MSSLGNDSDESDNNEEELNPFAAFAYRGATSTTTTTNIKKNEDKNTKIKQNISQIQHNTNLNSNTTATASIFNTNSTNNHINNNNVKNSFQLKKKRPTIEYENNNYTNLNKKKKVKYDNDNNNNSISPTNFKLFLEQLEDIAEYRERKNGNASVDNFRKYLDEKASNNDTSVDSLFHGVIAAMLSTQCLDKVALAAAKVFEKKFQTIKSCHLASIEDIEDTIKTVNFKNNKSKFTKGIAKILLEDFNSQVPSDYKSLLKLPGVGPKIAHLIRSVLFNIDNTGVVVDSNVYRVTKRIGWGTKEMGPNELSKQLGKWWPKGQWAKSTQNIVGFGQLVCTTKKPKCTICPLKHTCNFSLNKRYGGRY